MLSSNGQSDEGGHIVFRRGHLWMFSETMRRKQFSSSQFKNDHEAAAAWRAWEEHVESLLTVATRGSAATHDESMSNAEAQQLLTKYSQQYQEVAKLCAAEARGFHADQAVGEATLMMVTYSFGDEPAISLAQHFCVPRIPP